MRNGCLAAELTRGGRTPNELDISWPPSGRDEELVWIEEKLMTVLRNFTLADDETHPSVVLR